MLLSASSQRFASIGLHSDLHIEVSEEYEQQEGPSHGHSLLPEDALDEETAHFTASQEVEVGIEAKGEWHDLQPAEHSSEVDVTQVGFSPRPNALDCVNALSAIFQQQLDDIQDDPHLEVVSWRRTAARVSVKSNLQYCGGEVRAKGGRMRRTPALRKSSAQVRMWERRSE